MPHSPRSSIPLESPPATPLLWTPGEVRYPSIWTNGPLQANEDSADVGTSDLSFGWYHCQEFDCVRSFSSEEHLESHVKLFHQMQVGGSLSFCHSKAEIQMTARKNVRGERSHCILKLHPRKSGTIYRTHSRVPDANRQPFRLWRTHDAG